MSRARRGRDIALTCPIPDSYWLLEGQLLAGEYPGSWTRGGASERLALFLAAGIRTFIDLTEETDPLHPYHATLTALACDQGLDCRYIRFGIKDLGIPTRKRMNEILKTIKAELDEGRPVYFHCWGGIGRTGTVAGCWLVEQGLSADDALERVQMLRWGSAHFWKRSPETVEQCSFVREWSKK